MFVYLVTNLVDGKMYIGKTEKTIRGRWREHLKNAKQPKRHQEYLYRALRKHGPENFHVQQLAKATTTEELNRLEQLWILVLKTLSPDGYNMTAGGDGVPATPEIREKLRIKALGRVSTKRQRETTSLLFKGKPKPATQRAKIAASWNDDRRNKMSKLSTAVNKIENSKLRDFTCPDCGTEFKQVAKGVYGGHRRFCLHYGGLYKVWLTWEGTVAEFVELYGVNRSTVYNWKNERNFVVFSTPSPLNPSA